MSYTQNIISEIKSITEKSKSYNKNKPKTVYAQSQFIDKLLQMEKNYNKKTKAIMPDYNNILPVIDSEKNFNIKDAKTLKKQAGEYVADIVKQERESIRQDAGESEQKLRLKQLKAGERHKENLEKTKDAFYQNHENISEKMSRQGL
ncbi:MAG: hypothetical protein ACOCWI_05395, partial [Bacillota bacterium]